MSKKPEQAKLKRLYEVFKRLADENQGTRYNAVDSFVKILERERINILDLKFSDGSIDYGEAVRIYKREIAELKQANVDLRHKLDVSHMVADARIAELENQLDAASREIEANEAALREEFKPRSSKRFDELQQEIDELRNPGRSDPLFAGVTAWLDAHPELIRISTRQIMSDGCRVPATRQDRVLEQRVGLIMRAIVGWKPSENIMHDGKRVRGYIRLDTT